MHTLLRQGIVVPVSAEENIPVMSPIVLVAKRNKPKLDPNNITPEQIKNKHEFL